MATIQPVMTHVNDHTVKFTYTGLTTTDFDGGPICGNWSDYTDRNVQVEGAFGTGGNLRIEGSNNGGTNYRALNDNFATALNITAVGARQINEVPELMRPNVTAGDGSTSLNVSIILHRPPAR